MLHRLLFSLLCLSLLATPIYAVDDPVTIKLLSEQIIVAKQTLSDLKEQLEEMKVVSDGVLEVRDTIDDVYGEYETLKSLNIKSELNYLEDQYLGLTRLNQLGEASSLKEKYALLHDEVDLRFKRAGGNEDAPLNPFKVHAHETLIDLNWVDEEIAHYKESTKALSESRLSDKDLQKFIAQSQAITARLLLEQKKQALEAKRAQQTAREGELLWDKDFIGYLEDPRGESSAIADNPFSRFIVRAMDPQFIYKSMALLSGVPSLFLWLVVLFGAVRLYQEASGAITGKAAVGEALQSMGAMVTGYMVYFSSGFLIFSVIFAYFTLFEQIGSVEYIQGNLLELRTTLDTGSKGNDWVHNALETVIDTPNVINFAWTWVVYQAVSLVYVSSLQFIGLLFALGVAFLWAFGFIAIPTAALKDKFNLVGVWAISVFGLFMWGLIDIILMALLAGLSYYSSLYLVENHTHFGAGFTGVTIWHLYVIIMMVLVVVLKLLAIWLAFQVTSNQSMVGSFAGAATAVTMMMANKTIPSTGRPFSPGDETKNGLFGSSTPEASGDRKRDSIARFTETIGSAMDANISDVGRASARGIGGLASQISDFFVAPGSSAALTPETGMASSTNPSAVSETSAAINPASAEVLQSSDALKPSIIEPTPAGEDTPSAYDEYTPLNNGNKGPTPHV